MKLASPGFLGQPDSSGTYCKTHDSGIQTNNEHVCPKLCGLRSNLFMYRSVVVRRQEPNCTPRRDLFSNENKSDSLHWARAHFESPSFLYIRSGEDESQGGSRAIQVDVLG
jgi:hypothetical protein